MIGILTAGGSPLDAVAFFVGSSLPDVDTVWNKWGEYRQDFLGHRGITHSFYLNLFLLLGSFFLYLYDPIFSPLFFLFLGSFLHVLLDALSPSGVPLYLSYRPRIKFPIYKTGTKRDEFIALTVAFCLGAVGFYLKAHKVELGELLTVIKSTPKVLFSLFS